VNVLVGAFARIAGRELVSMSRLGRLHSDVPLPGGCLGKASACERGSKWSGEVGSEYPCERARQQASNGRVQQRDNKRQAIRVNEKTSV